MMSFIKKYIVFLLVITTSLIVTAIYFPKMLKNVEGRVVNHVVEVYETTGNKSKLLQRQSDLVFDEDIYGNTLVTINDEETYQEITGFGAAMTHAAAYNIENSIHRDDIIKDFFSPSEGAGFNVVRIPIGATDYAPSHFTLNDSDSPDETLSKFNLDTDEETIIPVLQSALTYNPDIEFVAAPWSAPAWMKTTNSLYSGSLKEEYETVYANYLLKFVLSYQAEGIDISYLSIQNEPYHSIANYPNMFMDYDQSIRIINILGPMLEKNDLDTQIIAWDHNADGYDYGLEVLRDEQAYAYVSGVAFHGYYGNGYDLSYAFQQVYSEFPEKEIYFTEMTAGDWSVDFASNISYALQHNILPTMNNNGSFALYWNLILDEDNQPYMGGAGNSNGLMTLLNDDSTYVKNAEYYALSHLSQFLELDQGIAKRIATESSNDMIMVSAFERHDGKKVVILLNTSDLLDEEVEISYDGMQIVYTLEPQSVVTLVW